MAKLYFRYGSMNCGKTTNLLQVAHNYEERGMNVLILKPSIDTKGNNKIVSRLGVERKVDMLINEYDDIFVCVNKYLMDNNKKVSCILVDEVHFLNKEQINDLMDIVVEWNIPVICYGLRTDFKMDGFEGSSRLMEIAHDIEELKNICECGKKAIFNARKINGEFVFDGDTVVIDNGNNNGNKDSSNVVEYVSLCAECYYDNRYGMK